MSCNAIQLRTSEILNSTFRSRVFELTIPADNRNPANDVFTAKVKIKGTEILEIPGNIVGNRVIFQLTELENTNKFTDYEIDYWANLDALGKELLAQEDLRVASKVQPDRCLPNPVQADLHFGDIVIPVTVTQGVVNIVPFPETGNDTDVLVKDSAAPDGVKWSDRLTNVETEKLDKPPTDGSWVITKSGSTITYTDASTVGSNIANTNLTWSADRTQNLNAKKLSFTGGRVSVPALELEITAENSIPNKVWTDGVGYYFNNNLGVKKKVAVGSVFTYTPTGDFALSTVKTAMESEGFIFNDAHVIINLGANNFTCNIDLGVNHICTFARRGSGSISFTSSRTLNAGTDDITIMNGNEASMALIQCGTSTNFLTIRNE